jgi:hypothetical protein
MFGLTVRLFYSIELILPVTALKSGCILPMLNMDLYSELNSCMKQLVTVLKGKPLSFYLDELQIFSTKLTSLSRSQLPRLVNDGVHVYINYI